MKLSSVVVRALALPLLLISVFFTTGCGGGTVGTDGGGSTKIVGLISTSDGLPVAGATVQVGTERITVETDVTGHFSTEQIVTTSELAIVVTTSETSSQITVADLPLRPEQVEVEIEVRVQDKNVRLRKQVVKPRPTPTAIPSVTETIASIPTPLPTTIPLEPTPTPVVVEPTATSAVTPTPVVPEETPPVSNNPSNVDPSRSTIQPILFSIPNSKSRKDRLVVSGIRAISVGSASYRGWLAGAKIIARETTQTTIRLKLSGPSPSPLRSRFTSSFILSGTPDTSSSLAAPIYLSAVTAKSGKYYLTSLTPGWTIRPALPSKVPVSVPAKPPEHETEYVVRITLPNGFDARRILTQYLDTDIHSTDLARSSENNRITFRSVVFSQMQPSQLRLDIDLLTSDGLVASVAAPLSNARSGRENNQIDARLVETASGFSLEVD